MTPFFFGGIARGAAGLLHFAFIAGGPGLYRFLGAGEQAARQVVQGDASNALVAAGV